MATLADVARLAGVSTATVSHVVNGTRNVRPETRRLVEEAIEETGYSQNTLARSLVTASTKSIAVVLEAMCAAIAEGTEERKLEKEKEAQEADAEGATVKKEGKPRIKKAVKAAIDAEEAAVAEVVAAVETPYEEPAAAPAEAAEVVAEAAETAEEKAE